jgi:hypothetical protein
MDLPARVAVIQTVSAVCCDASEICGNTRWTSLIPSASVNGTTEVMEHSARPGAVAGWKHL